MYCLSSTAEQFLIKSDTMDLLPHPILGWGGAGLGTKGQGIEEPVKGGDVRSKMDMFKGVGMNINDPFEQFRRNKSYTYNRRGTLSKENLLCRCSRHLLYHCLVAWVDQDFLLLQTSAKDTCSINFVGVS